MTIGGWGVTDGGCGVTGGGSRTTLGILSCQCDGDICSDLLRTPPLPPTPLLLPATNFRQWPGQGMQTISSRKLKPARTPGSIRRHTYSAFMGNPHPPSVPFRGVDPAPARPRAQSPAGTMPQGSGVCAERKS